MVNAHPHLEPIISNLSLTSTDHYLLVPGLQTLLLPKEAPRISKESLKEFFKVHRPLEGGSRDPSPLQSGRVAMNGFEPESDLRCLIENDRKLRLCGYYYGTMNWLAASKLLKNCKVGTFLVRDSEHFGYLYSLSVQTTKGPTSCRIGYTDGSFRLDCCSIQTRIMPTFESVPQLIEYYVHFPKYLSDSSTKAVWFDLEESNKYVPVQMYRPLYKRVNSLQHLCRLNIVGRLKDKYATKAPVRTLEQPNVVVSRTLEADDRLRNLPAIIKDFFLQYPFAQ